MLRWSRACAAAVYWAPHACARDQSSVATGTSSYEITGTDYSVRRARRAFFMRRHHKTYIDPHICAMHITSERSCFGNYPTSIHHPGQRRMYTASRRRGHRGRLGVARGIRLAVVPVGLHRGADHHARLNDRP